MGVEEAPAAVLGFPGTDTRAALGASLCGHFTRCRAKFVAGRLVSLRESCFGVIRGSV